MRFPSKIFLALLTFASDATLFAKEKSNDQILLLGDRRVTIAVPDGYIYSSGRNEQGVIMVKIADAREKIDLQVRFQPDPESRLGAESQQMEFLANVCQQYAESSVEKSYNFTPLAPHRGAGTYCMFTDASLVGREPPPGEVRNVTTGVKAWPGWALVFTILSNDTASKEYQTALKLMRESFEEKPVAPPKV
jgi:hypothetical protein